MSMYSNDKCNFCNSPLKIVDKNKQVEEFTCQQCYDEHKYNLSFDNYGGWLVTFRIKGYYFQMFYRIFNNPIEILEIICPNNETVSIPECRKITIDNYLQEVERAKKLQIFK